MILFAARAIKILLLLAVLFIGWRWFHRRLAKQALIWLGILTVSFAVMANFISGSVPPVRDEVTLTAQDEKCNDAKGVEVFLAGYTIDDESFSCGESLVIKEGHWFWEGETYAWRPETDTRQPDGVTRTVVLEIPVGWNRTLDFSGNPWRGVVEINNGVRTWTIDTYSESDSTVPAELGRSKTSDLILNQIRCLAVYLLVLFGLSAVTMAMAYRTVHDPKQIRAWLRRNWEILSYAGIALCSLVFMCAMEDAQFWYDDISQISYLQKDLLYAITVDPCTPPLFSFIAFFWYKIAPYGEQYLLFICKFITAAGIFLLGITGRRFFHYLTGLFAMLLGAFNYTLVLQCGQEFRAYSTFFFLSVVVLYLFLQHIEDGLDQKKRHMAAYAISIALSAYTHYFGVFICVPIFLYDCILFIRRKVRRSFFVPYLLGAVLYLPWIIYMLTPRNAEIQLVWPPTPDLSSLQQVVSEYLCGNVPWEQYLFFFSAVWLIVKYIQAARENSLEARSELYLPMVFVAVFLPLMMYFYGNCIHYKSTFWCDRYFTCLLPYVLLICGMGLTFLFDEARKNKRTTSQFSIAILIILGIMSQSMLYSLQSLDYYHSEPMKDAADWIYSQSNYVFNDNTLILTPFEGDVNNGWGPYYVERQGQRDRLNVASVWNFSEDDILMYDRIYYVYIHKQVLPEGRTDFLNQYYTLESDHPDVQVAVYVRPSS